MTDNPIAASYDAVAESYAERLGDELAGKPIDRAWLACLAELAAGGTVADVGCGPGHITAHLVSLGAQAIGIDLSPGMIKVARRRYPDLHFDVGSLLDLPAAGAAWAGAVCPYSIIHLTPKERPIAFAELARVIAPGGWLLLYFHISNQEYRPGEILHMRQWWGHDVELDFHLLDPAVIAAELAAAGFRIMARTEREPWPDVEHQSRRAYLLAQR